MKYYIIAILAPLLVSCSKALELDKCTSTDDAYYISILSKELNKRKIKHTNLKPNEVCYSSQDWLEYDQAAAYVNSFYRNVATIFKRTDQDRAKIFIKILDEKGKKYKTSINKSGDLFIVIFAESPSKEVDNRKLLNDY